MYLKHPGTGSLNPHPESAAFLCTDVSCKGPFQRRNDPPSHSVPPPSSSIAAANINTSLSSTFSTIEGTRHGRPASPSTSVPSHSEIGTLPTGPSRSNSIGDVTPFGWETPTRMLADEVSNPSRNSVPHVSTPTPSSSPPPPYDLPSSSKASKMRYEKLLDVLKQAMPCSLCWFFSDGEFDPHSHTSAFTCPRGIMNTPGYRAFRAALRFLPTSCMCFKCCEPQHPPFAHPKGTSGCKYNDVIKPIAYVIFKDDQLRAKVFGKMQMPANRFSCIADYQDWLVQRQENPGSMVNIHEVLLAYYELYTYGTN
jgi:hypothetical protein